MHPDFTRWYASIGIVDDPTRYQSRWSGVSAVVQSTDSKDVEALIRLGFKSRQSASVAQVQKIRQAFKVADPAFDMQGNDRELQVMAAASLVALMEKGSDHGAKAALAITTTSLNGIRKPELPMDLPMLAERAIIQIAETKRRRPDLVKHASTDAINIDFEKSVEKVKASQAGDAISDAFTMAAAEMRTAFVEIIRRQTTVVHSIDQVLRMQDEELQMLWWLTGQRSFDLDCTFDAVSADAQPLVFGKELADNSGFLPGPVSVKALLSRAGLKDRKKIALSTAINAADQQWFQTFMAEIEPSSVSTPIHFGIKRQLEAGLNHDAWITGWAAATDIAENFAVSPLMLARLFYRERLLIRFGG